MMFLVFLLGVLWLFQVVLFESVYQAIKVKEIESAGRQIAAHIELDNQTLAEYAVSVAVDNEACVMIFDDKGNILVSEEVLADCLLHRMSDDSILQLSHHAKQNGGEKLTKFQLNALGSAGGKRGAFQSRDDGDSKALGESLLFAKVVRSDLRSGHEMTILLNTTASPVGSTVRTLRIELVLFTVFMIPLAAILSFLLAKRISKPIAVVSKEAKRLADGKYDAVFPHGGYREIDELSDTLSYAENELAKTEHLRKELVANISHDLRTPLTMIGGYAEMMRDIPGENSPENLQIIIDETARLTSLVNDVLDISRLQSGTQTLSREDFDLTATIREVIGRFAKLTGPDGWTITFDCHEEVTVHADRTRILQVIYNFINNAITHSGDDRTVLVRQTLIERDGRKGVRVEVADHGEGIPEEALPNIWDRYYKVDQLHKRAQTGSGLGLSIVKTILEMHSARYGVESKEGEGSTFWFEL